MKSRHLKSVLQKRKNSAIGRIIVLTGARQTGKTTLVKHSFPEYEYLSIEDPVLRIRYKNLTTDQWMNLFPKAVLDEVQKEPVLIESIKAVYDKYKKARYVLLGSSQLLLLDKVKESLAGRCIIREVLPLTIPEILTNSWSDPIKPSIFQMLLTEGQLPNLLPAFEMDKNFAEKTKAFEYYLNFGGYPALVNPEITNEERYEWLENYVRTYLERDIRDLADFKLLEPFVKIQQLSAELTGQTINYSNLSNDADITSKTAKKFINYLEISFQIIMIKPWFNNSVKRLVKTPKLHYLDPGVQRSIIKKRGELSGHEFESAIVAEIYKQFKTADAKGNFYHLRSHNGIEVDLLIETEEGFYAFEIKQTGKVSSKDIRHLLKLPDLINKPLLHSFVLSNDNEIRSLGEKITAIPAAGFLS